MAETNLQNIPLNALTPYPQGFRVAVDEESLTDLAETVKTHGVLEPLIVRPSKIEPGKYEVVCGYRRLKAAEKVGLETLPCIVKELSDADALASMFIENVQREDFTDYEKGRLLKTMMEQQPKEYPTQEKLAEKVKQSQRMVSYLITHYETLENMLKQLPPNIRTRVLTLPEGITREIRRAPFDTQPKLVKAYLKSIDEGAPLSVRDMAKMVEKLLVQISREETEKQTKETETKVLECETESVLASPKKPVEAEKLEKPEAVEKPLEAVNPSEPEQSKPTIKGVKPKNWEAFIEEERKRILAEKGRAKFCQRLDQASRIYLLMTNFYPEPLVELVSCHLDFSPYTEDKAINLFKELLETILTDLTEGWKHIEKLEPYVKETLAWQ